ncbi:serine/threonine protein kinase [Bifidobacterium sp. DSM 109958]|uniref:non-specific serine/threonine protein kinase n=1 Tax=Bifidobacterium moraviense TaxID=2675323 RepID=A0A7Y0F1L8_9BIFI|nr:Stk1 family PASTA domain-containing Ser/Thr kinase [Bifidobacterium sp. DSM 109958]NMN00372.1 serine/threonine protein kinase [Bifidobacterium sp. DSM 109958]
MSEASNQPVGQLIEGRYRIVRKIAEGGMATVYEAMDERLSRPVAIKVMHTQLAQGPHRARFQELFRREARSAAAIANPHIVQVYDTGEFDGLDYLVMEYVHGVNLRHDMNAEGTFSVRETLRVVGEILDGLAAAHRAGVVHRDIKPENILINDRGHVQITDFGLAKAASQATLSSTGMLLGTAAYLAPEMIEHNRATMQGDLYAVGIIAWEMITGQVPFLSDNPVTMVFKHVHEDVPSLADAAPGTAPQVCDFVSRLTAREVAARPANAMEAADELRRIRAALAPEQLDARLTARRDDGGSGVPAGIAASAASSAAAPATDVATPSAAPTAGDARADVPAVAPTTPMTGLASRPRTGATTTLPLADPQATQRLDPNRTQSFDQLLEGLESTPDDHAAPANAKVGAAPTRRRRTAIIATAAGLILAAACAAGGYAWWYYLGPGSYWPLPAADDVACAQSAPCTVAGADAERYLTQLTAAGIPYERTDDYSDTVPSGSVIATDPDAVGSRVSRRNGQTVAVTVSKGVRQATVPADIADPTSAAGKDPLAALAAAGFDAVTHDASSDDYSLTVPEGAVLSISVDAGGTYAHNAPITVTLSKGPKPVNMPNVTGLSRDDAVAALTALNLKANVTEAWNDKVEAGKVVSASAQEGAQLKWGDAVDVVVSKGPQTAIVPNVVGKQYDEAEQTLKALGFDVQKSAPLGDWTHTVRVQSVAGGDTVRIRDANGTPTVITLTVA